MESNTNDTLGNQNSTNTGTSDATFSRDSSNEASGLADRARGAASTAGEKLSDAGSAVRERAGGLKNTIADALASGADRLRQQSSGGARLAGATATVGGADTIASDSRLAETSNQLAGGMQGAADWLRDADLDGFKSGLEQQVKEHPGRTLAIAVGVGYLLGKAFRK